MTQQTSTYAGDIPPADAYESLSTHPGATLIDVRTTAEWTYVGIANLAEIGKEPLLVEWQTFPTGALNPSFATTVAAELEALGTERDAPLYFLCRSGVRSKAAAIALTALGYTACYNIAGGFEGPLDQDRHRTGPGWKAAGLPWMQT